MAVELVYLGRFYAWSTGRSCEVLEFLEMLEQQSNPDAQRLMYLIKKTAETGHLRNEYQCRKLEGKRAQGLFEFKAPNGSRILWFYDKDRVIICSHGFVKKGEHTPRTEIERAQAVRQRYLKENQR